jgi:hypothetical protein
MKRTTDALRATIRPLAVAALATLLLSCSGGDGPSGLLRAKAGQPLAMNMDHEQQSAAGDTKAFIGGWLNGEKVALRYTRMYYCDAPRGASPLTFCEVGTPPEDFARPGEMPKIYAIAPVGFAPDPATVHCPGGIVCPNHPPTLDVPPLGDANTNVFAPAHSHIITERQGGWHNTVNIRVTSLDVWNQIVANPTLETVRMLQANPRYGGARPPLISQDLPTNVFFFFEVHNAQPQP